jgi:hypothetical protein
MNTSRKTLIAATAAIALLLVGAASAQTTEATCTNDSCSSYPSTSGDHNQYCPDPDGHAIEVGHFLIVCTSI